jgi:ATP-binding cassette subfamily B protein
MTRILAATALAMGAARGTMVLYIVLTLLSGVLPIGVAWLTKLVVDGVVGGGPILALAGGLALAGVLTAAVPTVIQYLRAEVDRKVGLLAQDRLFTAVDRFTGLARFEDPRFLDRLRLAQQATDSTAGDVVDGILGLARSAITVVGMLASLFLLSPLMSMLVLVTGLPTLVAEIVLSRRRARMFWDVGPIERRELFYATLLSTVDMAKEVRLFGIGRFLRDRMLSDRRTANAAKRRIDRGHAVIQTGLGVFAAVVAGGGLIWAAGAARDGQLSAGDVMIFVAAVGGVQGALAAMAVDVARAHYALLMFEHYDAVVRAEPDLPVPAPAQVLPPLHSGIELRDIWFRYSEDHPWVLRGVNLVIPHGTTMALVGRNGAGKSTLVKLLCRFYDPTKGSILWDGVDIRDVDPLELRTRIGAIFQDYVEYDMTAAENIALSDVDRIGDRNGIETAARRAGIHDKLATLPQGYDTLLTRMFFMEDQTDGVVLSGGQWQRLALARAFFRDRRELMILDEPSAGLDAVAEQEIHAAVRQHGEHGTCLLISHRLSAIRDADQVVVLSDGQVTEQGSHDGLMAAEGQYAQLFTVQAAGYQPAR